MYSKKLSKMKNIKILFVILFVILFFTKIDTTKAQIFGIKAGLNLSNMSIKIKNIDSNKMEKDTECKYLPGFNLGPTLDFPLNKMFLLQSEILFTTKGFQINTVRSDEWGGTIPYKYRMTLYYIDIPLNLKATIIDLDKLNIYGLAGSYLGIGINGKTKFILGDEQEKGNIKLGSNGNTKRFDFGLDLGTGIELNKFVFNLSYYWGLTNISRQDPENIKEKNRVLAISLGYRFGNKF